MLVRAERPDRLVVGELDLHVAVGTGLDDVVRRDGRALVERLARDGDRTGDLEHRTGGCTGLRRGRVVLLVAADGRHGEETHEHRTQHAVDCARLRP